MRKGLKTSSDIGTTAFVRVLAIKHSLTGSLRLRAFHVGYYSAGTTTDRSRAVDLRETACRHYGCIRRLSKGFLHLRVFSGPRECIS